MPAAVRSELPARRAPGLLRLAAALVALAAPATRAQAQAPPQVVELDWNAPADCPSRASVFADIARIIGGWQRARVPVVVRADVTTEAAGRWRAAVSLDAADAHGDREFEAESCVAVASAVAVIVAVTVEGGVPPPAPATPAPPPSAAVVAAPAPPAPVAAARAERTSRFVVDVGGVVDTGTMPDAPAVGAELALGWSFATPRWQLRALAGVGLFPPQDAAAAAGQGGQFSLVTASARACVLRASGRFAAGPCLGGEVDRMTGSGTGSAVVQPGNATGVWGAALAGVDAAWAWSPYVSLTARAEGVFAPAKQRFVLRPNDLVVHSPSRIAARLAIGVELRFW